MATDLREDQAPSVTALTSGIIDDVQELLKQQFELFKHELRDDVAKIKVAALALATAAGVGFMGFFLLGITLGLALNAVVPSLPLWGCFAIVTAVFFISAGALCALGVFKLKSIDPMHDETAQALKENVQWVTKPK
jgi:uncharacterized membrane protein YqjE